MEIIINETKDNHLKILKILFKSAKKVAITVAFIKQTGLTLLYNDIKNALDRGCKITLFTGTDFYLTEPKALRKLYRLFNNYESCKLFISEQTTRSYTFHPKLYSFMMNNLITTIIGSANMTEGGFVENTEVSLMSEIKYNTSLANKLFSYFRKLEQNPNIKEASEITISQYERKYEIFHTRMKKAQHETDVEIKRVFRLNLSKINEYLQDYYQREEHTFNDRKLNYKNAKIILNKLITEPIRNENDFLKLYEQLVGAQGKSRYWWSGSLFRLRRLVAKEYKIVVNLIKIIKENSSIPAKDLFKLGLNYTNKVYGLGVNTLTEIMSTYNQNNYAVLNNNSKTSIESVGFAKFPEPNYFNEDDYDTFNRLLFELKEICHFESLSQVDHFLNFIYWEYVKKNKD